MRILHLSDTTLSGSPIRIAKLFNTHTKHEARHMVWEPVIVKRVFETDLISSMMSQNEIENWLDWADVLHFHNRWRRQMVFKRYNLGPPSKPSVIQMHSPRSSENFRDELGSGVPLAAVAQYQVREWPEASFVVPNVVDITDPVYQGVKPLYERRMPLVSYSPSNFNARGRNDKGYGKLAPVLKKLKLSGDITYQLIVNQPHGVAMSMKKTADIGIDEVTTGSYHLSSLEYLSMGIACFARLDQETIQVVQKLTGCDSVPWVFANESNFQKQLMLLVNERSWAEIGARSRNWMERYWNPELLIGHYERMYNELR
jgi:hypothetical protein